MNTLIFILILSFLVIIHELGHYFAAKWAKVKVDEFGLGYPPRLFRLFRWRGTDFTFNWIPFGGFVQMQGEDEYVKNSPKKTGQFYQASPFKKLVIVLAGPAVNFFFGIFAFTIVFFHIGVPQEIPDARIGEVHADSPAANVGILPGTNIIGFQATGEERVAINSPEDLISEVAKYKGEEVQVFTSGVCEGTVCLEEELSYQVYLRTSEETPEREGSLGVVFDPVVYLFYPPLEMMVRSISYGLQQAFGLGIQIVQVFNDLVINFVSKATVSGDVAGPVGIVHQAQQFKIFEQGFLALLSFSAMLSVNLAVMNALPFPPLDGGRAFFVILSTFLKKKRIEKIEYYSSYAGYVFLLGLIVVITIKDVVRIFQG